MPCPRVCIDDLCRGNLDNTLCGGCYCSGCHALTVEPGDCDGCRGYDDADDWDEAAPPAPEKVSAQEEK